MARSQKLVEQIVRPTGLIDPLVEVRPARTQVDDLFSEIRRTTGMGFRVLVTTLTKRMAEDLTEYLGEHHIKVRYLHSDIDTLERMEIIRDLRLGSFDVLVGINLLREGLDIPEVALVAILDADKEGFLRSERSLIQTMGRAARNLHGRVILYADTQTDSMRRAIETTESRRLRQQAHNEAHGITPCGIEKGIANILTEGDDATLPVRAPRESAEYATWSPIQLTLHSKKLEQEMYRCAEKLAFEEAARLRDEIRSIDRILQQDRQDRQDRHD